LKFSPSYLDTAKKLALKASQVVLDLFRQTISKSKKEDNSWVTEADLRSDEILREGLQKSFPDHSLITEENGISGAKNSDWVWLIDPLDGTKAYEKGIEGFSVMVGLLKSGIPYLGVVVDPLKDFIYEAVKGGGAFLTYKGKKSRLHVSERQEFSKMPLVISPGFPQEKLKPIQEKLQSPLVPPINSVGIKVGLLVRQVADIYINHHSVHYWDTCAPQIILEEAGGVFTKINGDPLTYELTGNYSHHALTLASNGPCHDELVKKFKTTLANSSGFS